MQKGTDDSHWTPEMEKDWDHPDKHDHDLDVFFPEINGMYVPICLYNGHTYHRCPSNINSMCTTRYRERPRNLYHPWDGKNAIKCNCG